MPSLEEAKNIAWAAFISLLTALVLACICSSLPARADGILFFHSEKCGPCKAMEPLVWKYAAEHKIYWVDVDKQPEVAADYGVKSIPYFCNLMETEHGNYIVGEIHGKCSESQLRFLCESRLGYIVVNSIDSLIQSIAGGIPMFNQACVLRSQPAVRFSTLNESSLPQKTPHWLVTNRGSGQVCLGDSTMGLYHSFALSGKHAGTRCGRQVQLGLSFMLPVDAREKGREKNRRRPHAVFECDCGNVFVAQILSGRKINHRNCLVCMATPLTHGMTDTPEFKAWGSLIQRCINPKNCNYPHYGARGISVCERWRESFENFFADMGRKPASHYQIDRIDNDGNYEPTNCRWVTPRANTRNRRCVLMVEYQGETLPLVELAERHGLPRLLVYDRVVRSGWTVAAAVETPVKSKPSIA